MIQHVQIYCRGSTAEHWSHLADIMLLCAQSYYIYNTFSLEVGRPLLWRASTLPFVLRSGPILHLRYYVLRPSRLERFLAMAVLGRCHHHLLCLRMLS